MNGTGLALDTALFVLPLDNEGFIRGKPTTYDVPIMTIFKK